MVHVTLVKVTTANGFAIAQRPLSLCLTNQLHSQQQIQTQSFYRKNLQWREKIKRFLEVKSIGVLGKLFLQCGNLPRVIKILEIFLIVLNISVVLDVCKVTHSPME